MNKMSYIFIILCFGLSLFTYAESDYHEVMHHQPKFVIVDEANPYDIHHVVISIVHRNLDQLHDMLMERSDPTHPKYQQWLTRRQLNKLTYNGDGYNKTVSWLNDNHINITWTSRNKHYIQASAPISVWESLLNTTFYKWRYSHDQNFSRHYDRALNYQLPDHLQDAIKTIFNICQAPTEIKHHGVFTMSDENTTIQHNLEVRNGTTDLIYRQAGPTGPSSLSFLNQLYGIGSNLADPTLRQGIFETNNEGFSQQDLTQYQNRYGIPPQTADVFGTTSLPPNQCSLNNCAEGSLDIQIMMGVAQRAVTTFWLVSTGDVFVNFLIQVGQQFKIATSLSISWGADEQAYSAIPMDAFNTEALKLSALGVTISVSSGDNGVAGNTCRCTTDSSRSSSFWKGTTSWSGQGYFPSWPATSPYVVSVGGTQGPNSGGPEVSCQSNSGGVITSGGGFSTYFSRPTWQQAAVDKYVQSSIASAAQGYNVQGRGHPDISFIATEYPVIINGQTYNLYGTSAAAPLFASMITLINSQLKAKGQPTVGFVNPTLYRNINQFNDITVGDNKCCSSSNGRCCASGFSAAAGWDPVTGLGSIQFNTLAAMFTGVAAAPGATASPVKSTIKPTIKPSINPTLKPTVKPVTSPVIAPVTTPVKAPVPASTPVTSPINVNQPISTFQPTIETTDNNSTLKLASFADAKSFQVDSPVILVAISGFSVLCCVVIGLVIFHYCYRRRRALNEAEVAAAKAKANQNEMSQDETDSTLMYSPRSAFSTDALYPQDGGDGSVQGPSQLSPQHMVNPSFGMDITSPRTLLQVEYPPISYYPRQQPHPIEYPSNGGPMDPNQELPPQQHQQQSLQRVQLPQSQQFDSHRPQPLQHIPSSGYIPENAYYDDENFSVSDYDWNEQQPQYVVNTRGEILNYPSPRPRKIDPRYLQQQGPYPMVSSPSSNYIYENAPPNTVNLPPDGRDTMTMEVMTSPSSRQNSYYKAAANPLDRNSFHSDRSSRSSFNRPSSSKRMLGQYSGSTLSMNSMNYPRDEYGQPYDMSTGPGGGTSVRGYYR